MHNQGPDRRKSETLLVGNYLLLRSLWWILEKATSHLPKMELPGPEIHHKTAKMNGFTIQQVMFEDMRVSAKPSTADRI